MKRMTVKIALWGTGRDATVLMERYWGRFDNIEIIGICDSSMEKQNRYWFNKRVESPEAILKKTYDYIVIATKRYAAEIQKILLSKGIRQERILFIEEFENRYRVWNKHRVELDLSDTELSAALTANLAPSRRIHDAMKRFEEYKAVKSQYYDIAKQTAEQNHLKGYKQKGKTKHPIVWVCWLQGYNTASELAKLCINRMYQVADDVRFISKENFRNYVDIEPQIIEKWEKGIISNTHFSDLLRLLLLINHGGVWLDATIFVTADHLPEYFYTTSLFMFKRPDSFIEGMIEPIIYCNWMISAEKGHPLLKSVYELLVLYWEDHISCPYCVFHFFMTLLLEQNQDMNTEIDTAYAANEWMLSNKINQTFNPDTYKIIKSNSFLQKLSATTIINLDKKDSYFRYLYNNYFK